MGLHTDGTIHGWDIHMKDMHTERTFIQSGLIHGGNTHTEGTYTWRKHTYEGDIHMNGTCTLLVQRVKVCQF